MKRTDKLEFLSNGVKWVGQFFTEKHQARLDNIQPNYAPKLINQADYDKFIDCVVIDRGDGILRIAAPNTNAEITFLVNAGSFFLGIDEISKSVSFFFSRDMDTSIHAVSFRNLTNNGAPEELQAIWTDARTLNVVLPTMGDNILVPEGKFQFDLSALQDINNKRIAVFDWTQTFVVPPEYVLINGLKIAKRNIDMPGTFAKNTEDFGMYYQWNKRTGWRTNPLISSDGRVVWDTEYATGYSWEKTNDPSPAGWHIPKAEELNPLWDANRVDLRNVYWSGTTCIRITDLLTNEYTHLPFAGSISNVGSYSGNNAALIWIDPNDSLSSTGKFCNFSLSYFSPQMAWASAAYPIRCIKN